MSQILQSKDKNHENIDLPYMLNKPKPIVF